MAYSDFTLNSVRIAFDLTINEVVDLYIDVDAIAPSNLLQSTLKETIPLASAINTEKARSELIIAPILLEVRRYLHYQISLFSGIDFNVAPEKGLVGFCDFILSKSTEQLFIVSPVTCLVEAKNENIKAGLGQCVAEMLAAQLFNQSVGIEPQKIFGCVTTGEIWRFLQLEEKNVSIDLSNYYIKEVEKILGILISSLNS